jgi:hypothetical protein
MASGLKINFFKSSLIGINVDDGFMSMACNFLNCSEGRVPFNYLAFRWGQIREVCPLGKLSGKLNTWGHKYISFGGRIVLLNAIPIFFSCLI